MDLNESVKLKFTENVKKFMVSGNDDRKKNVYHVSSLVYGCNRFVWYVRRSEDSGNPVNKFVDEEALFRMWIGTKLHETPVSDYHEKNVMMKIFGSVVSGTVDEIFIVDAEDNGKKIKVLIDKKFIGTSLPKTAREHNMKQALFYATMMRDVFREKIDAVGILYFRPVVSYYSEERIAVFTMPFTENEYIANKIELESIVREVDKALKEDYLPPKKISWFCNYCDFKAFCAKEEKLPIVEKKNKEDLNFVPIDLTQITKKMQIGGV